MKRSNLVSAVSALLGNRQLVWVGTRGDDVESATDVPQLAAAFSAIGAYRRRSSVESLALEDLTGLRVDLDAWDIDEEVHQDALRAYRRALLTTLSRPTVLFAYRPSRFLSSVGFARRDRCTYLGMFAGHQDAFEHKPWLETAVAELGLPGIQWTYVADEEQLELLDDLAKGPMVLRPSRGSGGRGLVRVDDPADLEALWPRGVEAFASVARYIDGAIPVNVGAVAWDRDVTVHHASVQLIGTAGCTRRPFGYCGNDFVAIGDVEPDILDDIDAATVKIGHWLRERGYRGAFGVDFLVKGGTALFTEVNPRFQGSTHATSQLSVEDDRPCILLEHLAAFLGLDAPRGQPLRELVRLTAPLAHLVVHWTGETRHVDPKPLVESLLGLPGALRVDVMTRPDLLTEPGATVARFTMRARITTDGFDLLEPWRSAIDRWTFTVTESPSPNPAALVR